MSEFQAEGARFTQHNLVTKEHTVFAQEALLMFDRLRNKLTAVVTAGATAVATMISPLINAQPAEAIDAPKATIGMPFEGRWAFNAIVNPPYTDANSSHPAVHNAYGFDWATDLYAGENTEVKVYGSSEQGTVTFKRSSTSDTCPKPDKQVAGRGVTFDVLVEGSKVGQVKYDHLDLVDVGDQPIASGTKIGEITTEPLDASCYQTRHAHIQFLNSTHYSCYVDHGRPGETILAPGTSLGIIGSTNTSGKQVCDASSGGGGQTPAPQPGPTFRPAMVQRPTTGETDVAVVGPGNSLVFYYNAVGSPVWGSMVVPGAQAHSTPAMLQRPSGETTIAARGPNNSLNFYFNDAGSREWHRLPVAYADTTYGDPAMIQRPNGQTVIAVRGPNDALDLYINDQGSPYFMRFTVPGAVALSDPDIIERPSGETDIAVQGRDHSLDFYYNPPGTQIWARSPVAIPGWAHSDPKILQRPSGETDIVVEGPNNSLDFYYNPQGGGWGRVQAAGPGTTFTAGDTPAAVQRSSGETDIAVRGRDNTANFYYNQQGSRLWGLSPVAVNGHNLRMPAIAQRQTTGETDLAVIGPDGRLFFFMNDAGSNAWGMVPIAGAHSAS